MVRNRSAREIVMVVLALVVVLLVLAGPLGSFGMDRKRETATTTGTPVTGATTGGRLTLAVDAAGRYAKTWQWELAATVDQPTVATSADTVALTYAVTTKRTGYRLHDILFKGAVTVHNPDPGDRVLDGLRVATPLGTCTPDAPEVVPPGDTPVGFVCVLQSRDEDAVRDAPITARLGEETATGEVSWWDPSEVNATVDVESTFDGGEERIVTGPVVEIAAVPASGCRTATNVFRVVQNDREVTVQTRLCRV